MHPHSHFLQHGLQTIWAVVFMLSSHAALAHESKPAIAVIEITGDKVLTLELTANLESLISGVGPEHNPAEFAKAARYASLRKLPAEALESAFKEYSATFLENTDLQVNQEKVILNWVSSEIPDNSDTSKARQSVIRFTAELDSIPTTLSWQWSKTYGVIALRIHLPDKQDAFNAYLEPGIASEVFDLSATSL